MVRRRSAWISSGLRAWIDPSEHLAVACIGWTSGNLVLQRRWWRSDGVVNWEAEASLKPLRMGEVGAELSATLRESR